MTNTSNSNASFSDFQVRQERVFPRPLQNWLLKIAKRVKSTAGTLKANGESKS